LSEWYTWDGQILTLNVHIQPRAGKDEVAGLHGDRLKIRIKAPPVDGKANRYLIEFLADVFGVAKNDVVLLAGETGRAKRFRIRAPKRWPAWWTELSKMD
jgi:uncharacterized protein (TIGR00251 family)